MNVREGIRNNRLFRGDVKKSGNFGWFESPEVRIYKRNQKSKKKERIHALDQEADQENEKDFFFFFFLTVIVFFFFCLIAFLAEIMFSFFFS